MSKYVGRRVKPGSTLDTKTTSWRARKPVFKQEACTGCETCRLACPEGCVFKVDKKKYDVNLDYCKGCGICAEECPVKDILMQLETGCEEPEPDGEESKAASEPASKTSAPREPAKRGGKT